MKHLKEQNLLDNLTRLKNEKLINKELYKELKEIYTKQYLPDENSYFYQIMVNKEIESNYIRSIYNSLISWLFIDKELIEEIKTVFKKLNIKSSLEIFAGTGIFSFYLNKYCNISVKAYTKKWENDFYFSDKNLIFSFLNKKGIIKEVEQHTEFYDLEKKEKNEYDVLIANWIPYLLKDAEKVITNLPVGKYLLVTTEGEDGCIANNKFHKMIEDLELVYIFRNLKSFPGIHDRMYLYRNNKKKN